VFAHRGHSLPLKPRAFRSRGWWPNRRPAGLTLTLIAGAVLVTAEAALIAHASAWRALALTGAALSPVFFLIFFQPLILFGSGLDVAVPLSVGYLGRLTTATVGA
jgi:hypothetical protein